MKPLPSHIQDDFQDLLRGLQSAHHEPLDIFSNFGVPAFQGGKIFTCQEKGIHTICYAHHAPSGLPSAISTTASRTER